jgi:phytanoyl-CoA hydroxylase
MKTSRELFERDGYVVLRKFLSSGEIHALGEKLERFIAEGVPGMPAEHVFYEQPGNGWTLKQLQHLDRYDPYFNVLFRSGKVAQLAERLLGNAAIAKNMQWFNKPPRIGKETPPHQDGFYFMLEPNKALTMWLAIDHVDEANGCVRYIPGSHRTGLRPHGKTGVLGFSQGITDYGPRDAEREVPMVVEPGDLIVHHSLTIHRADANTSNRTRKGLGFIFYSADAEEDEVKHRQYQEALKEEMLRSGRIGR